MLQERVIGSSDAIANGSTPTPLLPFLTNFSQFLSPPTIPSSPANFPALMGGRRVDDVGSKALALEGMLLIMFQKVLNEVFIAVTTDGSLVLLALKPNRTWAIG